MISEPQSLRKKDLPKTIVTILSLIAVLVFLFYGFLMLPMLGLETDEIMFVYDLPHPHAAYAWFGLLHHEVPYMMMTYLGALKSWLYAPLFAITNPNVWAIRTPVLLLAAITIMLTGWLLRQIHGWNAALIAICLLSTDVVFQVTAVFDWGPVVVQNFLLVLGLILIVKWHRTGSNLLLFGAGLMFGLNMWNKALFIWNLSGIGLALVLFALPEIIRLWRVKRAAVLFLGFCVGAAPLIALNIKYPLITFRDNSHLSLSEVGAKANYLKWSLDGKTAPVALILSQYPVKDPAHRPFESMALALAGTPRQVPANTWRFLSGLAFIFAGLAVGTNTQRRWILFFFISGGIGWFESAMTLNAGNSIHHTVLFWIHWYCAVALGAACLTRLKFPFATPAVLSLLFVLSLRGLLSENLAYANLISFSPGTAWTDADEILSASLLKSGVKRAVVADWGIANVIGVRSDDKIDVSQEQEFELNAGRFNAEPFGACTSPDCVIVTHDPDRMMFPAVEQKLNDSLQLHHMAKKDAATVKDSRGFPIFSVFSISAQTADGKAVQQKMEQASVPVLKGASGIFTALASRYPHSSEFRFWATPTPEPLSQNGRVQVIHWTLPGVEEVEVHVESPTGTLFTKGGSAGNETTGPWANAGGKLYLETSQKNGRVVLAEMVLK